MAPEFPASYPASLTASRPLGLALSQGFRVEPHPDGRELRRVVLEPSP